MLELTGAHRPWLIDTEPLRCPSVSPEEQTLIDKCLLCEHPRCINCLEHHATGKRPHAMKKYDAEKFETVYLKRRRVADVMCELGVGRCIADRWIREWKSEREQM